MAERYRAILFEDNPVNARIAQLYLPRYGVDVVEHAPTVEEGLELADRAGELDLDGAVVDRDLGSCSGHRLSDGARIMRRLKARTSGIVLVEFSADVKRRHGIIVPRFGGHYAVLKEQSFEPFTEVARLIKSGRQ